MIKKELVDAVSFQSEIPRNVCDVVIDEFINQWKKAILRGEKISLSGLMTMEVTQKPEHRGRNPATNKVDVFPPTLSIKTKVSKQLKNILNERT